MKYVVRALQDKKYVVRALQDKKKLVLILLFGSLCTVSHAVEYAPFTAVGTAPITSMQSVNNSGNMSSGSVYTPTVYEVGSSAPSRAGVRKAPPSITPDTPADVDPANTNYGPVGDALIPLLLMVMAYVTYLLLRRRKSRV